MQGSFLSLVLLFILAFDVGLSPFEDDIVTLSVFCLSSSLWLIIFSCMTMALTEILTDP